MVYFVFFTFLMFLFSVYLGTILLLCTMPLFSSFEVKFLVSYVYSEITVVSGSACTSRLIPQDTSHLPPVGIKYLCPLRLGQMRRNYLVFFLFSAGIWTWDLMVLNGLHWSLGHPLEISFDACCICYCPYIFMFVSNVNNLLSVLFVCCEGAKSSVWPCWYHVWAIWHSILEILYSNSDREGNY